MHLPLSRRPDYSRGIVYPPAESAKQIGLYGVKGSLAFVRRARSARE
jgi:hypothetical protein